MFNPLNLGNPETKVNVLLQTVNTQINAAYCFISSESSLLVKVKKYLLTKNTFKKNYNLTPLDMNNGLFIESNKREESISIQRVEVMNCSNSLFVLIHLELFVWSCN